MIDESTILYKKAIDVQPYLYAMVHTFPNSADLIASEIVFRRWTEDGSRILFGLDSHNGLLFEPDAEVAVVMVEGVNFENETLDRRLAEDARQMAKRPPLTVKCPCCLGTGKVPKVPDTFTEGLWIDGGSTYEVVDGQIVRRI
jgi:hypothetical protein